MGAQGQADLTDALDGFDRDQLTAPNAIAAAIVMVATGLLAWALRGGIRRWGSHGSVDPAATTLVARPASYLAWIVGLVYAASLIGVNTFPVTGVFLVLGAIGVMVVNTVLGDFVAGLTLKARQTLAIGDDLRISEHEGTVRDIDARVVTIESADGESIYIGNGELLAGPLSNYPARPARASSFSIKFAPEVELGVVIEAVLAAMAATPQVLSEPPLPF